MELIKKKECSIPPKDEASESELESGEIPFTVQNRLNLPKINNQPTIIQNESPINISHGQVEETQKEEGKSEDRSSRHTEKKAKVAHSINDSLTDVNLEQTNLVKDLSKGDKEEKDENNTKKFEEINQQTEVENTKCKEEKEEMKEKTPKQFKEELKVEEIKEDKIIYPQFLVVEDFSDESKNGIEEYTCPLCKGIYYNPVVGVCGHTYCKACFDTFISRYQKCEGEDKKVICPICMEVFPAYPSDLIFMKKLLEKKEIYCKNKCGWIGKISSLNEHFKVCQKQIVKCPLDNCSLSLLREQLPEHLSKCEYRIIQCEFCHECHTYVKTDEHKAVCPKIKLECPQECGMRIERENLNLHLKNYCQNTVIACPFSKIGCGTIMTKKEKARHLQENINEHMQLLMDKFGKFEKIKSELNLQYQELMKKSKFLEDKINIPFEPVIKKEYLVINNEKTISLLGIKRKSGLEEEKQIEIEYKRDKQIEDCSLSREKIDINESFSMNYHDSELSISQKQDFSPKDTIFSSDFRPKEIIVRGNRAKLISNEETEHLFLFSNYDINCTLNYDELYCIKWSICLLSTTAWLGCGLCDKEQVKFNGYRFNSLKTQKANSNGAFLISTNGYIWNCNNPSENNNQTNEPIKNPGDTVFFYFYPARKELVYKFKIGDRMTSLRKLKLVYPIKGEKLTPCILFLHPFDEIEISKFNYN